MGVHIGTSGWHYRHWVGTFYPDGTKPQHMLGYYSGVFPTVEVNNTFYKLPEGETLARWRDSTPAGFVFAFKVSRYVTHRKKLRDAATSLAKTLAAASVLGEKLGPLLFQLPPNWRVNVDRLHEFLSLLPRDIGRVFEFRDRSWLTDRVYELLRGYGAAFCIYDMQGNETPHIVTSDLVYIRLHGPDGRYMGSYDRTALSAWANRIAEWAKSGKDVYCFFNNDPGGYAAQNARDLQAMLRDNRTSVMAATRRGGAT
ncbi:MAG: DUF72 domain-containing protein [Actinobacteria bacterium]|nr:DUF72 domain-containing protein [Actinomycetota bacterium]